MVAHSLAMANMETKPLGFGPVSDPTAHNNTNNMTDYYNYEHRYSMLCPSEMQVRRWQPLGVCLRRVVDTSHNNSLLCDKDSVMMEHLGECTTIEEGIDSYHECVDASAMLLWLPVTCGMMEDALLEADV